MKKFKISYLFILLFILINLFTNTTAYAANAAPALNSEGVCIINSDTNQVVYEKNADKKLYPASTTKVLTALVVIENSKLDEKVTVGKNPPYADGTSIGLREGDVYTVKELLCGLLLMSGNDCAETLAEHVAGSSANFAELMNKRAKKIGCTNSNFRNPSGLPDEQHYTTARDLAMIMNEAIKNPTFCEIDKVKILQCTPSVLDNYVINLANHNYILLPNSKYYYEYAQCAKKGYTSVANYTNVVSASKDNMNLVGAFLNGTDLSAVYSKDPIDIFNFAFDNYTNVELYKKDHKVGSYKLDSDTSIPLLLSKDVIYCADKSIADNLEVKIKYDNPKNLQEKSFKKGDVLTKATIYVNNNEYKTVDVVSGCDRTYNPPAKVVKNFFQDHEVIFSITFLACFVSLFLIRVYINKVKKKNNESQYNKF